MSHRSAAQNQFERARRQADLDLLTARFTGRDTQLLPFDVIRRNLRQQSPRYRGIQQVPLDLIIGSVGRYNEMTRRFLPLNEAMRERWIKVTQLALTDEGWPPVELYKVGDVYFVRDGNHRVSAARQLGSPTIEAHVWEYSIDVEIGPDDSLDEILIRIGERSFLDQTFLDKNRPDYDIRFTTPGRHSELLAQIEELRQKLMLIDEREVSFEEAADAWYDLIYLPAVQIIRESGLAAAFPGRTEADMFVWMSFHRDGLRERYGDFENLTEMAKRLMVDYAESPTARAARTVRRLLGSQELPPLAGLEAEDEEEE